MAMIFILQYLLLQIIFMRSLRKVKKYEDILRRSCQSAHSV